MAKTLDIGNTTICNVLTKSPGLLTTRNRTGLKRETTAVDKGIILRASKKKKKKNNIQ